MPIKKTLTSICMDEAALHFLFEPFPCDALGDESEMLSWIEMQRLEEYEHYDACITLDRMNSGLLSLGRFLQTKLNLQEIHNKCRNYISDLNVGERLALHVRIAMNT
jgi:hypothetical protein